MALLQIAEPGQSAEPHRHRLAVGIDLGTTNSLVATVRNSIPVVLDDARGEPAALAEVRRTMSDEREELLAAIEHAIDGTRDYVQAAALVRQLMFIDRFASEIGHADEAMHAPRASA